MNRGEGGSGFDSWGASSYHAMTVKVERRFKEKVALQFRAEAFNFTNTPTFGQPGPGFGNGNFGVIANTVTLPRQVQFGLKLLF
jgi:hypothetical protein